MGSVRGQGAVVAIGACACALASACTLDVIGAEEVVLEKSDQVSDPIADDRIEDKHPVFDPTLTVEEKLGGCTITINASAAVTELQIAPFDDTDRDLEGKVFPSYAAALGAVGTRSVLPTMELVNAMLKPFDDGLYAAVELASNDGSDESPIDKQYVFTSVLKALVARANEGGPDANAAREASAYFGAAVQLGGGDASGVDAAAMNDVLDAFHGNVVASTPIGFYTWTPALSRIFQRDRLLQTPPNEPRPSFDAFAATAFVLGRTPSLGKQYDATLALAAGLTNPFYDRPVTDLVPLVGDPSKLADTSSIQASFAAAHPETQGTPECAAHLAFVPSSDSPETKLFRSLYCSHDIPAGTNLLDVLIDAIRSGRVDFTPPANGGWYDQQVYALETLLVPERAAENDHLFLTKSYKEKLVETFKTVITETRETHVKQLAVSGTETTSARAPDVEVPPLPPAEPFPTFYLRTARAYSFVRALLGSVMGNSFLVTARRVLENGERAPLPIDRELDDRIALLYGLSNASAATIGMRSLMAPEEIDAFPDDTTSEATAKFLDGFTKGFASDADIVKDPRVIVPLQIDNDAGTVLYSAVVGTKVLVADLSYYPGHEPVWISGSFCGFKSWTNARRYLVVGDTVQVTRPIGSPPLTRDEFRAICDRNGSEQAIVDALQR